MLVNKGLLLGRLLLHLGRPFVEFIPLLQGKSRDVRGALWVPLGAFGLSFLQELSVIRLFAIFLRLIVEFLGRILHLPELRRSRMLLEPPSEIGPFAKLATLCKITKFEIKLIINQIFVGELLTSSIKCTSFCISLKPNIQKVSLFEGFSSKKRSHRCFDHTGFQHVSLRFWLNSMILGNIRGISLMY